MEKREYRDEKVWKPDSQLLGFCLSPSSGPLAAVTETCWGSLGQNSDNHSNHSGSCVAPAIPDTQGFAAFF